MSLEQRIQLAVDEAHSAFTHAEVEGLIRRAQLRYPNADLRRLDMLEERGLNRDVSTQLAACSFIDRQHNVVFQGFIGSGKTYLGSALSKQACTMRTRAHNIRMHDLEEAWFQAADKPQGYVKLLKKYASFTLLVVDDFFTTPISTQSTWALFEILEGRDGKAPTVLASQFEPEDWYRAVDDSITADSLLNRLIRPVQFLRPDGPNMRPEHHEPAES